MRRHATAWWGPKWPVSASVSAGIFGRILPFARPASLVGSCSPSLSASIIARPDWVRTGGDRRELDPGVLKDLLQTLLLSRPRLDLSLAIARQLPQLPDRQ